MSRSRLFFLTVFITTVVLLSLQFATRRKPSLPGPKLVEIDGGVFIAAQLDPQSVHALRRRGIVTLVDIRPDGEAANEPLSSAMEAAAVDENMEFHYIPVPHENIPDAAVDALREALARARRGRTVLYCRTGRRAVRLYALVEASRAGGRSFESILYMVRAAGFSADDLRDALTERIAHRPDAQTAQTATP